LEINEQALIAAITSQLPDMSEGQVEQVLTTWRSVTTGEPVGTIRRGPNGEVAHRVATDGVVLWRVTQTDGDQYNDMAPTLPEWELIFQPPQEVSE